MLLRARNRLTGKVVVVTGSASGIGAETARHAAQQGADLVLADINEEGLNRRLADLAPVSSRAVAVQTDVRLLGSWRNLLKGSVQAFRKVDVLVNCAGVTLPGPADELSEEEVRRQVEVNLLGTVYGTQVFLAHFRRQGSGHLIHVASLGGIVPMPGEAVYCATKFAVRGFCLALALELRGTPIKVSVVCPDSVETPQLRQEALQGGSSLSFVGALLQPSDVARAIVRTMLRPKREVLVPRTGGFLSKVMSFSPEVMALLYPVLNRIGGRRREDYASRLGAERSDSPANKE